MVSVMVLASAMALGGCLGGNTIACDFRAAHERCQDRSGVQAANPLAFQGTCEAAGGAYLDEACPRDGIVGGCDMGDGDVIDWYYAPRTEADVASECEGEGTVVAP
jgi:hypothetical protein